MALSKQHSTQVTTLKKKLKSLPGNADFASISWQTLLQDIEQLAQDMLNSGAVVSDIVTAVDDLITSVVPAPVSTFLIPVINAWIYSLVPATPATA